MSTNLLTAQKLRRKILEHIEGQQKADAAVSVDLRNSTIAISMELLQQVAHLLQSYMTDLGLDPAQEALFSRIAPAESLAGWMELCRKDLELASQITLSKQNARTAQTNYRNAAPLGPVSKSFKKLMKNEADTNIIAALEANRDQANLKLQQAEAARKSVREQMSVAAERIFRSAMRTEALEALSTMPSPVMETVRRLLTRFETEVQELSRKHIEAQMNSLGELNRITVELASFYEHLDVSQTITLLGEKQPS